MAQKQTYRGNGEWQCGCCGNFLFRLVGGSLHVTQRHHGDLHITEIAITEIVDVLLAREAKTAVGATS